MSALTCDHEETLVTVAFSGQVFLRGSSTGYYSGLLAVDTEWDPQWPTIKGECVTDAHIKALAQPPVQRCGMSLVLGRCK
jgi:hypothetical protein